MSLHLWLSLPSHVQRMMGVPSFGLPPFTPKHLFPIPRISPPEVNLHRWLALPSHVQRMAGVPSWELPPLMPKHLFPIPRISPPDVNLHRWLALPSALQRMMGVPLLELPPVTPMHLFARPRISCAWHKTAEEAARQRVIKSTFFISSLLYSRLCITYLQVISYSALFDSMG